MGGSLKGVDLWEVLGLGFSFHHRYGLVLSPKRGSGLVRLD